MKRHCSRPKVWSTALSASLLLCLFVLPSEGQTLQFGSDGVLVQPHPWWTGLRLDQNNVGLTPSVGMLFWESALRYFSGERHSVDDVGRRLRISIDCFWRQYSAWIWLLRRGRRPRKRGLFQRAEPRHEHRSIFV